MTLQTFKASALGLFAALALAACVTTNPATGEKEFTPFMTPSQEEAIGAEENPKLVAEFGGEYDDLALGSYVEAVGDRLAQRSEMADTEFEFTVLNSPIINAFALPGGYVNISRGLMAYFNDEAELAGVLGHEIGHVTARHAANRYNRTIFAGLGAAVIGAVSGSDTLSGIVNTGAQLALLSYSRGQESQSDGLGLRYMGRVGYDPYGSVRMLESLDAATALEAKKLGIERDATPSWARTHPLTSRRIAEQNARVEAMTPKPQNPLMNREKYLDAIDGMLFGDDPRQGVIRGPDFLHPVLRLAFTAPQPFVMQNSARYVIGGAENAQFAFAGGQVSSATSTRSYLDRTWNALFEGGAPQALSNYKSFTTNGMETVSGETRLQQEGGALDVKLIAYRYDATHAYHFILLTAPEATPGYQAAFSRLIGSFRKLSPSEAAAIKPWRIRVITVKPGDTVSSLAAQMAVDSYKEELFRVINGLEAGEGIQAGQKLKIIVEG